MPDITYEVLALRYGIFDGRLQFQNYIIPDDHAAPDPLDFYVFAVRGNGRTIVMDTGFNPVSAKRRGRELLRTPADALMQAGIDPAEVPDVVLTHMHWYHAGGMEYFPKATFHLQAAEMVCQPFLRRPFYIDDVQSAVCALYTDRLRFHDGTAEIAPGITLHLIGGHSGGIQSVRVPTERGWVVLAGDSTHLWGNIRKRMPFPSGGRGAYAEGLRDFGRSGGWAGSHYSGPRSADPEAVSVGGGVSGHGARGSAADRVGRERGLPFDS